MGWGEPREVPFNQRLSMENPTQVASRCCLAGAARRFLADGTTANLERLRLALERYDASH